MLSTDLSILGHVPIIASANRFDLRWQQATFRLSKSLMRGGA